MTYTNNKRLTRAHFGPPAVNRPWRRKREDNRMRLTPRTLIPDDIRAPGAAGLTLRTQGR